VAPSDASCNGIEHMHMTPVHACMVYAPQHARAGNVMPHVGTPLNPAACVCRTSDMSTAKLYTSPLGVPRPTCETCVRPGSNSGAVQRSVS